MRTITIYEAFDGKRFEDEEKCINYEGIHFHTGLFRITFVNNSGNFIYTIDKNNIFNDDIYQKCEEIYIPDEESLKDLLWLAEECGWCEFENLSKLGHWKRKVIDKNYNTAIWILIN